MYRHKRNVATVSRVSPVKYERTPVSERTFRAWHACPSQLRLFSACAGTSHISFLTLLRTYSESSRTIGRQRCCNGERAARRSGCGDGLRLPRTRSGVQISERSSPRGCGGARVLSYDARAAGDDSVVTQQQGCCCAGTVSRLVSCLLCQHFLLGMK